MEVTRLFDLPFYFNENWPGQVMLASKQNSEWKRITAEEVIHRSRKMALSLICLGILPGDRIGIIAPNSPEWLITDYAIQQCGAISVPVYPSLNQSELLQIFSHSRVKIIFTGSDSLYEKVETLRPQLAHLEFLFTLNQDLQEATLLLGIPKSHFPDQKALNDRMDRVKENNLATLIYTSGTTGIPKGVMLSHANILSNSRANAPYLPIEPGGRALSFLPLCHIYERMCTSLFLQEGLSIWFAEGLEKISDNLKEVQPHIFATVPRLLEKVYNKIILKGMQLKGMKRLLFDWSIQLGHQFEFKKIQNPVYSLQLSLARKLIFTKWQEALGGNIRGIISGGSALQPRLARIFWAAGIPVVEGYGLTETSPVIAVNYFTPQTCRFGTVGQVIQGCKIKILKEHPEDQSGEILTKGPGLMLGYFEDSAQTQLVIDSEGWFHTGDIGYLDDSGFLKITDRKKEIFKNSGGKYIAPQPIENKLKESLFIQNALIVGEYQDHPAALIVPDKENILQHFNQVKLPLPSKELIHKDPQVRTLIHQEIKKLNQTLSITDKVHTFCLLDQEWTQDSGELTPTQKLRRKYIEEKYQTEIRQLFLSGAAPEKV
jgi:long-chain acyl-CoA synthetase